MQNSLNALRFAVRPTVLAHYLGELFLVLAALTVVPAVVAFGYNSFDIGFRYLCVIGIYCVTGWLSARIKIDTKLQKNEALVITALIFVIPPFLATIPIMGYGISFIDAYFEAVSAITTTGLSTLPTVENLPGSFHFGRAWLQWVGGLGVVVLSLAFLVEPGNSASHLGFDRRSSDDLVGGTRSHAQKMLAIYVALTGVGIAVLWVLTGKPLESVTHTLAAISTGGFSNYDDSLAGFDGFAPKLVISVISISGAIAFYTYYRAYYSGWRSLVRDSQLRAIILACGVTTALVFASLSFTDLVGSGWERLEHAFLMAVSAQTTSGFSSLPVADLDRATMLVLIFAMYVGGGMGSTAGGIKLVRLLILIQVLRTIILRASTTRNTHVSVKLDGKTIRHQELEAALVCIFGLAGAILISWFFFLAYGHDPLPALFDVTSAVGTTGISAGVVGPDLAPGLKLLLCFDMLLGRVELVALLILILPGTWAGKRRNAS